MRRINTAYTVIVASSPEAAQRTCQCGCARPQVPLRVDMSLSPAFLGREYDAAAELPQSFSLYSAKRDLALAGLQRAEEAGDDAHAQVCWWEMGLCDLVIAPFDSTTPWRGGSFDDFAAHYRLTDDTLAYVRERIGETEDIILKIHYLTYLNLRLPRKGREWIERQRQLLRLYRAYIDGCRAAAGSANDFRGLYIDRALAACQPMLAQRGVLGSSQSGEPAEWARYTVDLAEESQNFPGVDDEDRAHMRYRWIFDYLPLLKALPAETADAQLRDRALALLDAAWAFYSARPLSDDFARKVARVDAELREHWGEADTKRIRVEREYRTLLDRARFHEQTGSGLLAASFYQEAREFVEQHRDFFDQDTVADLHGAARTGLAQAIMNKEFKQVAVSLEFPREMLLHIKDTAEATIATLTAWLTSQVPDRAAIRREVTEVNAEAPLQALLSRTMVGDGKKLGSTNSPDENLDMDVEAQVVMRARILGAAVALTLSEAATQVGLVPDHVVEVLDRLGCDDDTRAMLRTGVERFLAGDHISASHILVPRPEDVLRQNLRAQGVDTMTTVRDRETGVMTTEDATFGALLSRSLRDGRSVEEYLGSDLWHLLHAVLLSPSGGLNLRNDFAHGLARASKWSADVVGITIALLLLLSHAAQSSVAEGEVPNFVQDPSAS